MIVRDEEYRKILGRNEEWEGRLGTPSNSMYKNNNNIDIK
jgi:hypothetical protein